MTTYFGGLYNLRQQSMVKRRRTGTQSELKHIKVVAKGIPPTVFVKNFQQHHSAITGELIKNERQYQDHLKRHNVNPAGGCDAPVTKPFEPHVNERVVQSAYAALESAEGSGQARINRAAEVMRERGLMR